MEVIARQLRLVTLITVGWCLQAQAQPTDFSLPPLPDISAANPNGSIGSAPPIPSRPIAPNVGAQKVTVVPEATEMPVAIPELADLPIPAAPTPVGATATVGTKTDATATEAKTTETSEAPALPAVAEATDNVAGEVAAPVLSATPPSLTVSAPPSTLPGLSLPVPPAGVGAAPANAPVAIASTTLPEVDVQGPPKFKMGGRTWTSKLAPSYQPKITNFNYRRQVLPDAIYRKSYDRDNSHLPRQVTRDDYARLLVERVASNDINATRALLNEGLSVNTTDDAGQTLLAVARRYGATDTERLLIARGAS